MRLCFRIFSLFLFTVGLQAAEFGRWSPQHIEVPLDPTLRCWDVKAALSLLIPAVGARKFKFSCPSYYRAILDFEVLELERGEDELEVEWVAQRMTRFFQGRGCYESALAIDAVLPHLPVRSVAYFYSCQPGYGSLQLEFEALHPVLQ